MSNTLVADTQNKSKLFNNNSWCIKDDYYKINPRLQSVKENL